MFPKIKLPGSMTCTNVRFDVLFAAENFWMEQILQSLLLIKSVIALVKQLQPFRLVYLFFAVVFFFHPVFHLKSIKQRWNLPIAH